VARAAPAGASTRPADDAAAKGDAFALAGLGCTGDESLPCCDAPAYGQTVVVEGRLVPDRHGAAKAWGLDEPKLRIESGASAGR